MTIQSVLPCIYCLAALVSQAHATTISFTDLTDGPVGVSISLSPGTRLVTMTSSPENANVVLLVPKGLFTFPAGVASIGALAALLEPPGESEGGSGSISDLVTLTVAPGAAGTAVDGVTVSFSSDAAGLNFSPVPAAILEDGTLQVVDGAFTIPNPNPAGPRLPYALPASFSVGAQSDVPVPEPSTLWLAIPGLLPVVTSVVKRIKIRRATS